MQILSHDAIKTKVPEKEKTYIGYFSGSKTHDRDFAVIEDALIEMMEQGPVTIAMSDYSGFEKVGPLGTSSLPAINRLLRKLGTLCCIREIK